MTLFPGVVAAVLFPLAWLVAVTAFARAARPLTRRAAWLALGVASAAVAAEAARGVWIANLDALHGWPPLLLGATLGAIAAGLALRRWQRYAPSPPGERPAESGGG